MPGNGLDEDVRMFDLLLLHTKGQELKEITFPNIQTMEHNPNTVTQIYDASQSTQTIETYRIKY